MFERLEDIATEDLENELERRRAMALKAEYDQLALAADYVSKHYKIFAKLAEILDIKLPRQDDLCGAGYKFEFHCYQNNLDKYYRGNSGKMVWEK